MASMSAEAPSFMGLRRALRRLPLSAGNYPYVVARVKAKKTLLLPKDTYSRMLQMEIPSIARLLGEGVYRDQILALGARYAGVDLIERATSMNLAQVFTQVYEFSEGQLREMLGRYLDRWDVHNVKTILRGRMHGASVEDITEDIVAAGSFPQEFLQQVAGLETLAEITDALEGTVYARALQGLGQDFAALKDLSEYEDALARAYYADLLEAIPPATEPQILFRLFVRREIDMVNLKTLLRLWSSKSTVTREVFLDGGLELPVADLKGMVGLDLAGLQGRLGRYTLYDAVSPWLADLAKRGVGLLERTLEKHHLKEASRNAGQHPLSVLHVLDFLAAKEIEVQNIRIIARGKSAGLTDEEIRDLLVV